MAVTGSINMSGILYSDIVKKLNAPSTAGTEGQVLGLNNSLNPVWMDQTGGVEIDDTAGIGDTNKVVSADKHATDHNTLLNAIQAKYTKPESGIPASDIADGSLTEEKFTAVTLSAMKNDYVTPEMFGAVGDGTADDTQALQSMFDSGKNVWISGGTYLTSGIEITAPCKIFCTNATFKASAVYQDYVINITAQVYFDGIIVVDGNYKALNGIKISGAAGSHFGYINVAKCLVWGVNILSGAHQTFDYIYAAYCGTNIEMTVSRVSNYVVGIDTTLSARDEALLTSDYFQIFYVYDTSGYATTFPGTYFFRVKTYDAENHQFVTGSVTADAVQSGYVSKSCVLAFGGAVHLGSNLASQIKIGILDTRLGAAGLGIDALYGHSIDNYYSQADAIPVAVYTYNLGCYYGSVTFEGSKCGYNFISYNYDYSMAMMRSTGSGIPYTAAESVALSGGATFKKAPNIIEASSRRTLPYIHYVGAALTIFDSDSDITLIAHKNCHGLTLSRHDLFSGNSDQIPWGAKKIYFTNAITYNTTTISLASGLVSAGYSITGGTNGVLEITNPSTSFVITIVLLNKVFTVYTESLTPAQAAGT